MYLNICGLLFLLIAHISNCQSFEDRHQQCSTRSTHFGVHPLSEDYYDSLDCSSSPSSSLPTDYEIWKAIKTSLTDWHRNQKFASADSNDQQVCYEHFGCFRHKGPFDYLNTLPASPESIGTTFSLHTRKNPIEGEPLDYDDDDDNNDQDSSTTGKSIPIRSSFNSTNGVKIIIHGFGSSSKRPWVQKMTEVLLQLDDFNIINVDWQNGSKLPNYVQAAANTQLVGKQIARLIRKIERLYYVPPSRFHLIGFSLGAHVAGFAGQEITNISRITGLDPASPLFEGYPANVRLDPSDAKFVDVIHSNGDGFIRGGLGVGCSTALGALTNILYHGQWNLLCNHRRAFRFFIDSVHQDCTFRAFSCTSYEDYVRGLCFYCGPDGRRCSNMGYFANLSQGRGQMYLITRDKEPFCVNQFRVQIQFTKEQGVTWGQIELQLINADGMNETFTLTQEVDQLKESERIQGLIVAHPKLTNVSEITLTYTKYRGWIYYGLK
ncbi:hypothetical protein DERF_000300 [Dermatophagoides farinae]|uniref:Lipase domain-containing protein n=1 Tax=Dermatophagoides farinae TaxID=6954 RepID=A0A922I9W4_DERFA|nr:hypothetical protein DERF_000300 [Dermatophagoides farinae]